MFLELWVGVLVDMRGLGALMPEPQRDWIRIPRSRALLALSASGLIAGKKPVKFRPLLRAPRARKAYPGGASTPT